VTGEIKHWDGPPLEAWDAWTPAMAAHALDGVDAPWCVAGGWAIDLYAGRKTRHHGDLEIAVPRLFFAPIRHRLERRFALHVVGDGEVRRLPPGALYPDDKHQCWVLDEAAGKWRLDIMREPGDADVWIARRDESIQLPRAAAVQRSNDGIPYLAPEAVLLFKAKNLRPKDNSDFTLVAPLLPPAQRAWLIDALTRVHPGHEWIGALR